MGVDNHHVSATYSSSFLAAITAISHHRQAQTKIQRHAQSSSKPKLGMNFRPFRMQSERQDIAKLRDFLIANYRVPCNVKCNTHVHISTDSDFIAPALKIIAGAIIWSETAFEGLVPSRSREQVLQVVVTR